MADGNGHSLGLPRGGVLLGGLALAVVVLASGCARFATGPSATGLASASPSQASSAPSEAPAAPQFPVPEQQTILAVLDPEVVKPKVSAEEAVDLAFDGFVPLPEEPPKVQLLRLQFDHSGSAFDYESVWTGWVIFSTDIRWGGGSGPYIPNSSPQPTMAATFTWLYVSVDGKVLSMAQNGYDTVESVPSLPPEPAN